MNKLHFYFSNTFLLILCWTFPFFQSVLFEFVGYVKFRLNNLQFEIITLKLTWYYIYWIWSSYNESRCKQKRILCLEHFQETLVNSFEKFSLFWFWSQSIYKYTFRVLSLLPIRAFQICSRWTIWGSFYCYHAKEINNFFYSKSFRMIVNFL